MLTIVGCGGSETTVKPDAAPDAVVIPPAASLNVPGTPIDFGTVDVGAPASTQTFVVTNAGTGPANAITLSPSAGLTATGCATPLLAKATCNVTVSWAPTAAGKLNGSVVVASGTLTPVSVAVLGNAVLGADFSVSPSTIPLGNIAVGLASNQTITVKNNKAIALPLTVGLTGQDITKAATSTCGASLAANASCTVVVVFNAATNGVKSDSVSISGNGVTKEVPISATAQNPAKLGASPTALTLAAIIGQTDSKQVVVVNQGDMSTGIVTAAITGAGLAVTGAPECLAPIAGAKYCTFTVTYSPTATTAVSGSLTITDPGATSVSVTITATGSSITAPTITGSGDFGSVLVSGTSATTTFTIANPGDAATGPLTLSGPQGVFAKSSDTCTGVSLVKGATCTVGVQFKPTAVGLVSGLFSVTGAGGTGSKSLTGTGIPGGTLELAPATLDFGNVRVNSSGTARVVTVTNKGGAATGALLFTKTGEFGVFPVTGNTCSATLAPAATCTFTVNFAPVAAGSQNAAILVTDGSLSASLALAGNALAATTLGISPPTATACPVQQSQAHAAGCFEQTVVGGSSTETTFTVSMGTPPAGTTDSGAISVALGGTNPADFTIVSNGCTAPLVASGSCIVVVTFNPGATSVGLRQAALNVTSVNGGTATAALQSVGLSIVEIVAVDASSTITGLDFGQYPLLGSRSITPVQTHEYLLVVRGPKGATTTTTVSAALTNVGTPSDFNYTLGLNANPCTGTVFSGPSLTASGPNNGSWSPSTTRLGMVCSFGVEFYPQTAKGALTATLTASGSGGGSDTKTITGVATGPLTVMALAPGFPASVTVGDSTNDDLSPTATIVSLAATNTNLTLTVKNNASAAAIGPLSVVNPLTGANADQFQIVSDACTAVTLAAGANCAISIAFSPTSEGAKTATLTVNGSGETASYTINATAGRGYPASLSPNGYLNATPPATLVFNALPTVVAGLNTAWVPFTVSNPTAGKTTAQIDFSVTGGTTGEVSYEVSGSQGAGGCGTAGSTQLAAGAQCLLWVRAVTTTSAQIFASTVTNPFEGTLLVKPSSDSATWLAAKLSVRPTSFLTLTPATTDFGSWASAQASDPAKALTLSNLSSTVATLTVSGPASPYAIDGASTCGATLAAGASCTYLLKMTGAASSGTSDDTLVVTSAASSATAALTGKTVNPATLVAYGVTGATTINLGTVANPRITGPATVFVKNTGDVAANALHFLWAGSTNDVAFADPFRVLTETGATPSCLGLSSLAAGALCKLTINAEPSSTLGAAGAITKAFTVSANGGLTVTNFTVAATIVGTTGAYIDYVYPTAGSAAQYGFFSYLQDGTGRVAGDAGNANKSTKIIYQLKNPGAALTGVAAGLTLVDGNNWAVDLAAGGTNNCAALASDGMATGGSCTFGVTFQPNTPASTTQYLYTSLTLGGAVLGVMGQVQTQANLVLTPAPVSPDTWNSFGEVLLGSTTSLTLTLTNNGQTVSGTNTVAVDSGNAGDFTVTGCAGTLAAGASCNIVVTVQPSATGIRTTNVVVGGLTREVRANGVIGGDTLSLSPTTYAFAPALEVGATSSATTISVRNLANGRNTGTLTIGLSGSGASQFTLTMDDDCTAATKVDAVTGSTGLAGGASCVVSVVFNPKSPVALGAVAASLTVSGTPGGSRSVAITATAKSALSFNTDGSTVITTTAVANTVAGTAINVVLASNVTGPTGMLSTALSGTDASSFMIRQNGCVNSQLVNTGVAINTCSINVQYIGAATTTARTATLTVTDGTTGNTGSVAVTYGP